MLDRFAALMNYSKSLPEKKECCMKCKRYNRELLLCDRIRLSRNDVFDSFIPFPTQQCCEHYSPREDAQ